MIERRGGLRSGMDIGRCILWRQGGPIIGENPLHAALGPVPNASGCQCIESPVVGSGDSLNHLWAPWRMAYLEGHDPHPGCVFCAAASDQNDDQYNVVYRAPQGFVMLNLYPYNSGHLMVIPYQHTGEWDTLQPEAGSALFGLSQLAVRVLTDVMNPAGFNLGVNQGTVSGAGIAAHSHLHVVPRWDGATNFMPVLANPKVMPELLRATAARLRPRFAELAKH